MRSDEEHRAVDVFAGLSDAWRRRLIATWDVGRSINFARFYMQQVWLRRLPVMAKKPSLDLLINLLGPIRSLTTNSQKKELLENALIQLIDIFDEHCNSQQHFELLDEAITLVRKGESWPSQLVPIELREHDQRQAARGLCLKMLNEWWNPLWTLLHSVCTHHQHTQFTLAIEIDRLIHPLDNDPDDSPGIPAFRSANEPELPTPEIMAWGLTTVRSATISARLDELGVAMSNWPGFQPRRRRHPQCLVAIANRIEDAVKTRIDPDGKHHQQRHVERAIDECSNELGLTFYPDQYSVAREGDGFPTSEVTLSKVEYNLFKYIVSQGHRPVTVLELEKKWHGFGGKSKKTKEAVHRTKGDVNDNIAKLQVEITVSNKFDGEIVPKGYIVGLRRKELEQRRSRKKRRANQGLKSLEDKPNVK